MVVQGYEWKSYESGCNLEWCTKSPYGSVKMIIYYDINS
jgi:hypothetical protein